MGLPSCLLVAAVFVAGCTTTTSERPPGTERSEPPAVDGTGACDFDLAGPKAEAVFYTLGFLEEYNGRQIVERGDTVERLYCSEADLAVEFRAVLTRLSAEQSLPAPKQSGAQECVTIFSSPELAARLNSCYQYELNDRMTARAADGRGRQRVANGTFNFGLIHLAGDVDHARARAYLTGAWRRWGRDGSFMFANAGAKAEGVALLLSSLGGALAPARGCVLAPPRLTHLRAELTQVMVRVLVDQRAPVVARHRAERGV